MASLDLRDVFNLPADGQAVPRPAKKPRGASARPNLKGLAREVQSLGGNSPISVVPEASKFKPRRFAPRKPAARWERKPFRNSARGDNLILRHWRRKAEKPATAAANGPDGEQTQSGERLSGAAMDVDEDDDDEIEDSAFAKYNVKIDVPTYTDEQYNAHLQSEDWSREETDYLMEMVKDLELRWPVIWDRYEYAPRAIDGGLGPDGTETKATVPEATPRTMEDLKKRYYTIAARVMAIRTPVQYMTQQEFEHHETMANFDPEWEQRRKEFASNAMSRTKEEVREEENLLMELRRLHMRDEQFNAQRRELFERLDFPYSDQDMSSFRTSQGIQNLLQNLYSADRSKKRRSVAAAETAAGASPATGGPQSTGVPEFGRRDSIAASVRDSAAPIPTPTSAATKKAAQQQQLQQQLQQQQQQQQQQQLQPEKKLTAREEALYGVTHHDRLATGPTFRSEKINKLFTQKSNTAHTRITNALGELDMQARLTMPTAGVTAAFEQLLSSVNSLLDLRKQADKVEADLKLEMRRKEEREKAQAAEARTLAEAGADADGEGDTTMGEGATQTDAAGETGADARGADNAGDADAYEDGGRGGDDGKGPNKRGASVLSVGSDKSAKRLKK